MSTAMFLILMSLVAGILTGIVGMASLILYPVLLAVGIAPITANATITVAQVGAGAGTVLSSRQELRKNWRVALQIAVLNTIGGVAGAELLIHSTQTGFEQVVPFFILLAGVLILAPAKKRVARAESRLLRGFALGSVILVGIYNGYFGAASGLLMIAVLSRLVNKQYAEVNALRNFASFANNLVAAGMFILRLQIAWQVILPLLFGLFVGGLIGPKVVRVIPAKTIKKAVGIIAVLLAVILFIKTDLH